MYKGTTYAKQAVLVVETAIPELKIGNDPIKIIHVACEMADSTQRSRPIIDEVYWTHDAADSLDKVGINVNWPKTWTCNAHLNKTDDPTKWQTYNCFFYKKCYVVNHPDYAQIDFTLQPPYTPEPSEYVHMGELFGYRKNLFNMYLSYVLVVQLERYIFQWLSTIPVENGALKAIRNFLGQIIVINNISDQEHTVKLQMSVRPEYLYWVVETLARNNSRLLQLGLLNFKFLFLVGESKLRDNMELFPPLTPGDEVDTYTHQGSTYKRELLKMPNIVFYLKSGIVVKDLVDALRALFPDKYDISTGDVPRFNMRLTNHLFFSVGGGNQFKYGSQADYCPAEYELILKDPALRKSHAILSVYLTGTTLSENNVRSYLKLLSSGSFLETFSLYGLKDYYDSMFSKLKIANLLEPAAPTGLKKWLSTLTGAVKYVGKNSKYNMAAGKKRKKTRKAGTMNKNNARFFSTRPTRRA
jgi:hypothetical protein